MAKKNIIRVPFESIIVDKGFNSRTEYDPESIATLEQSISEHGLLQPPGVTAHKGPSEDGSPRYFLVYGFCRYLAIENIRKKLGPDAFAEIDVVNNEGTLEELRERNLRENIDRKNLQPHEIAQAIKKMVNSGLEQRDISARLGRPQSWVSYHYKAATKLVPKAWNAFKAGDLTLEQALNISDIPEESQEDIVDQVLGAETRSEARQVAKKAAKEKGSRRQYANKGKPTSRNLTQFVSDASFEAEGSETSEEERAFYNGVAAGIRTALGDAEFEKLSPASVYTDLNYHSKDDKEEKKKPKAAKKAPKKKGKPGRKKKAETVTSLGSEATA